MKKFFKFFVVLMAVLPCIFIFSACGEDNSARYKIKSIEETSCTKDSINYTITYEDGSIFEFSVPNNTTLESENMKGYKIKNISQKSFSSETVTYTITYMDDTSLDYTVPNNTLVSISSVEKTYSDNNKDIYTITLTNGIQTSFEVRQGVSIKDMTYSRTDGQKIYYNVNYTNGTSDEIYFLNGKDGKDGVSLEDMYDAINEDKTSRGEEPYTNIADFIADYLKVNSPTASNSKTWATGKALLSSVNIFSRLDSTTMAYSEVAKKYVNIRPFSAGAGVIYSLDKSSGDAYIVTNAHVVYSETDGYLSDIYCYLYGMGDDLPYSYCYNEDKTDHLYEKTANGVDCVKVELNKYAIPCKVIGASLQNDIAVLKISGNDILKTSNAIKASFANSDVVTVGEDVVAVGNPNSAGFSATSGIISRISEYIQVEVDKSVTSILREFRTDAAVNPGNSGGGLFNEKGEIVGIVNAKTNSSTLENMGYAIPSTTVKNMVENIIYNYEQNGKFGLYRASFGITLNAKSTTTRYNATLETPEIIEEVEIAGIVEYLDNEKTKMSLAKSMGLNEGDVILAVKINEEEEKIITRTFQVIDHMLNVRVGDTVTYRIMGKNGEETKSFVVTDDYMVTVK